MVDSSSENAKRDLLRHALATLAYRGGKALRTAPEDFSAFQPAEDVRSPGKILAHMGDLMDWALSIAVGKSQWRSSTPQPWEKEVERFFDSLKRLDDYFASGQPMHVSAEKLLQGPVADALTHVGQLLMLRRLAKTPMKSENYFEAEITAGRVGAEQTRPKGEF